MKKLAKAVSIQLAQLYGTAIAQNCAQGNFLGTGDVELSVPTDTNLIAGREYEWDVIYDKYFNTVAREDEDSCPDEGGTFDITLPVDTGCWDVSFEGETWSGEGPYINN